MHPSILKLKEKIDAAGNGMHDIELTYITSRGPWYRYSWKGDEEKSGGIATNIGVHFFDLLLWMFGDVQESKLYLSDDTKASGFIQLQRARVRWFLSIDGEDLPEETKIAGQPTHRSIKVDGEELEFTAGFTDLHTVLYADILDGGGFGIADVRPSIELVHRIRTMPISETDETAHPALKRIQER